MSAVRLLLPARATNSSIKKPDTPHYQIKEIPKYLNKKGEATGDVFGPICDVIEMQHDSIQGPITDLALEMIAHSKECNTWMRHLAKFTEHEKLNNPEIPTFIPRSMHVNIPLTCSKRLNGDCKVIELQDQMLKLCKEFQWNAADLVQSIIIQEIEVSKDIHLNAFVKAPLTLFAGECKYQSELLTPKADHNHKQLAAKSLIKILQSDAETDIRLDDSFIGGYLGTTCNKLEKAILKYVAVDETACATIKQAPFTADELAIYHKASNQVLPYLTIITCDFQKYLDHLEKQHIAEQMTAAYLAKKRSRMLPSKLLLTSKMNRLLPHKLLANILTIEPTQLLYTLPQTFLTRKPRRIPRDRSSCNNPKKNLWVASMPSRPSPLETAQNMESLQNNDNPSTRCLIPITTN